MAINAQMVKELREKTGAGMMDCKKALEANDGDIEASIKWLREKGISKAAKKADRVAAEGLVAIKSNDVKAVIYEVNAETDFVAKNAEFLALMDTIGNALLNNDVADMEKAMKIKVNGKMLEEIITNAIATIGEKISLRRFHTVTKGKGQSLGAYAHSNGRIGVVLLFKGDINANDAKSVAMHVTAMNPKFISREDVSKEYIESEKAIIIAEAKNDPRNAGKPENIIERMVEGRLAKELAGMCLLNQQFVVELDFTVEQYLANHKVTLLSMVRYEVGEGIEKISVDFASEVMAQVNQRPNNK